ncbi:high affinity cGMP-specific 3',5'-cyclic phosphodiesterase 9A-like [Clupea harengus]|uniref:Phosphodiesterase n=1 Tax=Clupea harengus TaxID=7950 RepID=A0A6P8EQY4_CLUHA|nr:high affinity cGMP-specific 3',5'-cyclic phosphodiesterase 9A-like [Clupea harengus]
MASKVVYFTINGRPEQAEFTNNSPAQDVKDLFRAAAEAGPYDILKMYNTQGSLINIAPGLLANDPQSCYRLEVVAAEYSTELLGTELAVALGFDLSSMEKRLQNLEKKIPTEVGATPALISEMKNQVEFLQKKLETVEHLSWLGLFKEMPDVPQKLSPFYHKRTLRKPQGECELVREKFLQMNSLEVSEDVRAYLKTPTFDNWQWEDAEIMVLLQVMYVDLDLVSTFSIELEVLQGFLYEVYRHYNNIPFHNFKHCFCVTQMMYGLICLTDLKNKIESIDLLIMLTSAVCHDLDHTGYNNAYQINAQTELALRYNDIAPLENHHCAVAFEILVKPENNIFRNLTTEQYKRVREGMIKCILATDMARHNDILNQFKSVQSDFDFQNKEHKDVLMKILVKVSDISNEARPMDVAEPWLDCLLQEFFNQSDMEKLRGLPVTPFMDRDKVTKPSSQTGFIRFVLFPLYTELANLFPCLEKHLIDPVRKALNYYSEMEVASEKERTNCSEKTEMSSGNDPAKEADEAQEKTRPATTN